MLEEGVLPGGWKKAVQFQSTKETLKTCLKIIDLSAFSLISVKFLKDLEFNSLFNYFGQNKLFTKCQSGFIPSNSCVAQLL